MRVKILSDPNIKKLECKVNEFVKDKCVINISHEIAVIKRTKKYINVLVIIILYHENNYKGYLNLNSITK